MFHHAGKNAQKMIGAEITLRRLRKAPPGKRRPLWRRYSPRTGKPSAACRCSVPCTAAELGRPHANKAGERVAGTKVRAAMPSAPCAGRDNEMLCRPTMPPPLASADLPTT